MRAVGVRKFGDEPEMLELPVPQPKPGEVLVEVAAASVNPLDAAMAEGHFRGRMEHVFPMVLGVDGVGRVVATGEGASRFRVGDLVHGEFLAEPVGRGTFAEFAAVGEWPEGGVLQRVPEGMGVDVAAALPTAGMTALGMVDDIGLRAGQSVLITGATGGVGVFAVQLAAALGAEVIATARPNAAEWIRGLGASTTIDYTAGDVRDLCPHEVDAFLDLAGDPAAFVRLTEVVRDGGKAVAGRYAPEPDERIAVSRFVLTGKQELLARIGAEVVEGRVRVPIQRTVALDEVAGVLRGSGARGKTTVRVTSGGRALS